MKAEDTINKLTKKALAIFYEKEEEWLINQMIEDMQENPGRYADVVCFPVEREKVIDLIKKGQKYQDLEHQLAEKDTFIKELQNDNRELRKGLNKSGLDYFISSSNSIRHQVCQEIRDQVYKLSHYDGICLNMDGVDLLEFLDQIEKGERK